MKTAEFVEFMKDRLRNEGDVKLYKVSPDGRLCRVEEAVTWQRAAPDGGLVIHLRALGEHRIPTPPVSQPDNRDVHYLREQISRLQSELADRHDQVSQLQVQLAGCLTAAEGGTSPAVAAQPGNYGWSPAYQRVLELRRDWDNTQDKENKHPDLYLWDYEFSVWPCEELARWNSSTYKLFALMASRTEFTFTEKEFADFREDLFKVGLDMREISRKRSRDPETVL